MALHRTKLTTKKCWFLKIIFDLLDINRIGGWLLYWEITLKGVSVNKCYSRKTKQICSDIEVNARKILKALNSTSAKNIGRHLSYPACRLEHSSLERWCFSPNGCSYFFYEKCCKVLYLGEGNNCFFCYIHWLYVLIHVDLCLYNVNMVWRIILWKISDSSFYKIMYII